MKIRIRKDAYELMGGRYPGGEIEIWEKLVGKTFEAKPTHDDLLKIDITTSRGYPDTWLVAKYQCEPMFKVFYENYRQNEK